MCSRQIILLNKKNFNYVFLYLLSLSTYYLSIKKQEKCPSNIKFRTKISKSHNVYSYFYIYIFLKIIYKNIIGMNSRWRMSSLTPPQLLFGDEIFRHPHLSFSKSTPLGQGPCGNRRDKFQSIFYICCCCSYQNGGPFPMSCMLLLQFPKW